MFVSHGQLCWTFLTSTVTLVESVDKRYLYRSRIELSGEVSRGYLMHLGPPHSTHAQVLHRSLETKINSLFAILSLWIGVAQHQPPEKYKLVAVHRGVLYVGSESNRCGKARTRSYMQVTCKTMHSQPQVRLGYFSCHFLGILGKQTRRRNIGENKPVQVFPPY